MQNSAAVSLAALLVSAVALGSVLLRSGGEPSTSAEDSSAVVRRATSPDGGVADRLEALAAENAALRARLEALESAPAVAAARTVDTSRLATKDELDALREELQVALGGGGGVLAARASAAPEEFEEQVAAVLSQVRRKEEAQKWQSGVDKRVQAIDETMPKINDWLQLSSDQSESMRSALLAQYERQSEYIRQYQSGADPEIIGELKGADREALRTELSGFLSPGQLETFMRRGGGK